MPILPVPGLRSAVSGVSLSAWNLFSISPDGWSSDAMCSLADRRNQVVTREKPPDTLWWLFVMAGNPELSR